MRSKEEIKKELSHIDLMIAERCFANRTGEELDNLRRKARCLREEMRFTDYNLVATDYEIDVYEDPVERNVKHYRITPHNIPFEIGFIKVSYGVAAKPRIGNIGYEISSEYRGHNYTSKALELLVDEMLSKNLDNPTLAIYPHNIPSVRTAEKFGGVVIYQAQNKFDWNIYQVDLKSKRENKTLIR